LVNALFCQAVKDGASDIHVEPYERAVTVRFRVDGLLHDVLAPPAHLHARLVSRLKIMARLDIAERRLPQDGRIRIRVSGPDVAGGLHAVLRQDPDGVLVGEIRDRETVEIALRAALTGHLVFSTLHTNDAPGAVTRLLDMEVEPVLISSSVLAVLAQRLVRLRCAACAGAGCNGCLGTGYRGRTAIHELLVIDDAVRALVMARADAAAIRRHAIAAGMTTLRDD